MVFHLFRDYDEEFIKPGPRTLSAFWIHIEDFHVK